MRGWPLRYRIGNGCVFGYGAIMNTLVFNSRAAGADVAWVADGTVLACRSAEAQDAASRLPVLAAEVVEEAERTYPAGRQPDAVIASIGPGSFTGIRAALAVAQGYALGAGLRLAGVAVDEALAVMAPPEPGYTLWTVIPARRDHVYLNNGSGFGVVPLDGIAGLPVPGSWIWLMGAAAESCAGLLSDRTDLHLRVGAMREPDVMALDRVGRARLSGEIASRPALPVYAEEARIKAGTVRPAPRT
ncbi:Glycoprotease family protein [Granulibacter bethesdensis]|uniref:Glycoprotease family protein n=2 Tax=Granulibacter bethesdensis TaxID=364410 RepID=A0AAN0RC57_9PROT|nr:Glycoprotease family protein [Granulibacter bethesdensis]AHJ64779.1 Glycoprotease family protein [Granulibacter bethesdensis CGDNIH4]APH58694.1 Glycoprotease family protein [Granulibacter bethesdensis]